MKLFLQNGISVILEKMKAIVGGDMALTEDVSLLPRETQVALKMLELVLASFAHYEMVLQNAMPIWDSISGNIESISINNRITISIPCVSCYASGINDEGLKEMDTAVLDGGWKKWTSENKLITTVVPNPSPKTLIPQRNHDWKWVDHVEVL